MSSSIVPPMEEILPGGETWELGIYNQSPVVFTGSKLIEELSAEYGVEIEAFFSPGDFIANEGLMMTIRGNLNHILSIKEAYTGQLAHLMNFSTILYRLKNTVKRTAPNMKILVRNIPRNILDLSYYKKAVEDAGCIYWPMSITDGIIHMPIWKSNGGIEKTIADYKRRVYPGLRLFVECNNISDGITAMKHGADGIILRNLRADIVNEITSTLRERVKKVYIEYLGEVQLSNIEGYANSGVDALGLDDIFRFFNKSRIKTEIKKVEPIGENETDEAEDGQE